MTGETKFRRRNFLKGLAALPSFFLLKNGPGSPFPWLTSHPRRNSQNPFVRNGRPILLIVEGKDLKAMLEAGLKNLPELEPLLKNKARITLKPNATASEPYPVTTDVSLLRELILKIKSVSDARLAVVDSTSFAGLTAHRVFSRLGYFDLGRQEKIGVYFIDPTIGSHFLRVSHPSWKSSRSLLTNKLVQDSDLVINLAIPKRHHVADFSCALKNNFGCTYDSFRTSAHSKFSEKDERGMEGFDQSLVEFADAVRPELTLVDARSLLIKSGPTFRPGKSEIKEGVNRLILSGDMVAVDAYCADLMARHDETFNKQNRVQKQLSYAQNLGLGIQDLNRVEIIEISA